MSEDVLMLIFAAFVDIALRAVNATLAVSAQTCVASETIKTDVTNHVTSSLPFTQLGASSPSDFALAVCQRHSHGAISVAY